MKKVLGIVFRLDEPDASGNGNSGFREGCYWYMSCQAANRAIAGCGSGVSAVPRTAGCEAALFQSGTLWNETPQNGSRWQGSVPFRRLLPYGLQPDVKCEPAAMHDTHISAYPGNGSHFQLVFLISRVIRETVTLSLFAGGGTMDNRYYWERFARTGNIQDYLSYIQSVGANSAGDMELDENDDGRPGDMGDQNRRSGQGDYPFDA